MIFKNRIIKKSVSDLISEHKVCNVSYNLEFKHIDGKKEKYAWLNPENQLCFNSGWYTEQDFYDWMNGHGKIVKGKTDEDKEKFWKLAVFKEEYQYSHLIIWGFEHFDLIQDYNVKYKSDYSLCSKIENPLKITKINKNDIISKIFGNQVKYIKNDLEYSLKNVSTVYNRYGEIFYGIKSTLSILECGFFGACNTPTQIDNLNWITDIVFGKGYYLCLLEKGIEMPDFKFVIENRYKFS